VRHAAYNPATSVTLQPGVRLGPYEVVAPLGAGGMGEVYKARDTRLDRVVAIKVLASHVVSNTELTQRFEREARTLAALSHPHICTVFDVGEQDGTAFVVMELVQGETVAGRLVKGPLPIDQVLRVAIEISDALDKAHRQGIVHRDLKPGNIMLTKSGAKLLDFGLAKLQPSAVIAGMSVGATVSKPLTAQGTILGTLHYMAPEQVEGREADARSDIFAFGAVVYEMATGKRAFDGSSGASVIAAILERDPPAITTSQPLTPPVLNHVVERCFAKDPDERWQSAGDVMRELKWIQHADSQHAVPMPVAARKRTRERLAWTAGLIAVAVATAILAERFALRSAPVAPEMRVDIATPPTTDLESLAVAPDGQKIIFAASAEDQPRLWLRSLDSASARPLNGTDRGRFPFWSTNSRSVAFFADGKLKRLDVDTGAVRDIAGALATFGGSWNSNDVILFSPGASQPIHRVSAIGGEAVAITRVGAGQLGHRTPHFLPDGHHFLYQVIGNVDTRGIYVGDLDGSGSHRLIDAQSPALFASGHLLFLHQSTLLAQPFDTVKLALTGNPSTVAEMVGSTSFAAGLTAAFSASATGALAYRTGSARRGSRQLVWLDRTGKSIATLADSEIAAPPALSPDGRRVAINRSIDGNADVYVLDAIRGGRVRFTSNADIDAFPVWSPDGQFIAFQSYQKGSSGEIYRKSATGAGPEERLVSGTDVKHPMDWSPDGRFLLFRTADATFISQYDIWALPLDGERLEAHQPFPVVQTSFDERDGQFSPDGHWIAYESNETGRYEIYLQPFPGPGAKLPVSIGGGAQVRWRRDGKELFYIALDGRLMAVPIQFSGSRQPGVGVPIPLFPTHFGGAIAQGVTRQQYAVSPDGQRFLTNALPDDEVLPPITLILNWKPKS
jgi:eukaryotic-like serine/threonine-protein kinase